MLLPWLLCGALAAAVILLLLKLRLLHKSMGEMCAQLDERLSTDTNTLLSISSRDRHARRLAARLNGQLRRLRRQRRQYLGGDRELKEAVTNISHDLRTPLTAICGYLDLLEQQEQTPEAARYLCYIQERAQAMKQLTEELLRYSVAASPAQPLPLEPVELNRALEQSVAGFYAPLKARGIAPVIHMPASPVVRRLNAGALARIFGNILTNALKYSGGDLEITLLATGALTFSNTAPGLDEVQVGKLFDRFFTVETAHGSTGLGLSIARVLTEQLGGSITARCRGGILSICLCFPSDTPG